MNFPIRGKGMLEPKVLGARSLSDHGSKSPVTSNMAAPATDSNTSIGQLSVTSLVHSQSPFSLEKLDENSDHSSVNISQYLKAPRYSQSWDKLKILSSALIRQQHDKISDNKTTTKRLDNKKQNGRRAGRFRRAVGGHHRSAQSSAPPGVESLNDVVVLGSHLSKDDNITDEVAGNTNNNACQDNSYNTADHRAILEQVLPFKKPLAKIEQNNLKKVAQLALIGAHLLVVADIKKKEAGSDDEEGKVSKNPVPYLSFVHNVNLSDRDGRDEAGDATIRRARALADAAGADDDCPGYMRGVHATRRAKNVSENGMQTLNQHVYQTKHVQKFGGRRKNRHRRDNGAQNNVNGGASNNARTGGSMRSFTPKTTIEATLPSMSATDADNARTRASYEYVGDSRDLHSTENHVDALTGSVRDLKMMPDGYNNRVQSPPQDGDGQSSSSSDKPAPHPAHRLSTVSLDEKDSPLNLLTRSEDGEKKQHPKYPKPRGPIQKKSRTVKRVQLPDGLEEDKNKMPEFSRRNRDDWMNEDFSSEANLFKDEPLTDADPPPLPPLPSLDPPPPTVGPSARLAPPPVSLKQLEEKKRRWGERVKDTSLEDELRRQRLAEERRAKAASMYEKLRGKKYQGSDEDEGPRFEDYGFLSKYCNFLSQFCIFNSGTLDMYRKAFDAVKEEGATSMSFEQVLIGLRGVNRELKDSEEEYLYRILELTGYKVTDGADFQLFAVMCALSQRISALDDWMKNILGRVDFKMLDMKMFMCRTLWECNVDPETNTIPIEQLCVELRAGGVSFQHECEVRQKLGHLSALDLLDFLTYIPLFLMIHSSVVDNPLDDSRTK